MENEPAPTGAIAESIFRTDVACETIRDVEAADAVAPIKEREVVLREMVSEIALVGAHAIPNRLVLGEAAVTSEPE
jgi:hypothetical protein